MTDDERVDFLMDAYKNGDAWFHLDQMVDDDPLKLRDLAWVLLRRLADARNERGLPDGRLH